MEIEIRTGAEMDVNAIAQLHADSWKRHYRGICTDDYLDNRVDVDRLEVWKERFRKENPLQHILIAKGAQSQIIGFACIYIKHHEEWGAYLDNLHVVHDQQGKGVGRKLMKASAELVKAQEPDSSIYLHVLVENKSAIHFYEKIGGRKMSTYEVDLPWGDRGKVSDYLWTLDQLL